MINTCIKWLKAFFILGVKKKNSSITLIFGICIKFLDEFMTVLLILLPPLPTNLLLSVLNAFKVNSLDNLIVFNKKISDATILLKS